MADKRELIDFLRNRQKSIEIKSKENGINLWVLIAASSTLAWLSIDYFPKDLSESFRVAGWFLITFQCFLLLFVFASSASRESYEVRYASAGLGSYPALSLLSAIWGAIPVIFFFTFSGMSIQSFVLGGLSFIVLIFKARSIFELMRNEGRSKRFPDPNFVLSPRADFVMNLSFCLVFLCCAVGGFIKILYWPSLSGGLVKFCCLISAVYLIISFAIERKIENGEISWTYDLEADLVFGLITPEVAERRIEHRSLGVRLAQVMDDFYDDMDKNIANIEKEISNALERAEEVASVPMKYSAERSVRWEEIANPSLDLIKKSVAEMKELVAYLRKVTAQPSSPRLRELIDIHSSRGDQYLDRLNDMNNILMKKTEELFPGLPLSR